MEIPDASLVRRWVCAVVRSGFHNGAHCDAYDPHDKAWGCGYRTEVSLTDAQVEQLKAKNARDPSEPISAEVRMAMVLESINTARQLLGSMAELLERGNR